MAMLYFGGLLCCQFAASIAEVQSKIIQPVGYAPMYIAFLYNSRVCEFYIHRQLHQSFNIESMQGV